MNGPEIVRIAVDRILADRRRWDQSTFGIEFHWDGNDCIHVCSTAFCVGGHMAITCGFQPTDLGALKACSRAGIPVFGAGQWLFEKDRNLGEIVAFAKHYLAKGNAIEAESYARRYGTSFPIAKDARCLADIPFRD